MLEVRNIFKTYEGKLLLNDISFAVEAGETICLLGPSGSGKSTLLRIIAGLESPDSGLTSFNGRDLTTTPPHLRDFGLVFQDYALFPHLNVNDNVGFGLKMRHIGQTEIIERIAAALDLVHRFSRVHLDTTMVGTGFTEQMAPMPAGYRSRLVDLADRVVLGTDFPNIPYPYRAQLDALAGLGLGDAWLRGVCWHNGIRLLGLGLDGSVSTGASG